MISLLTSAQALCLFQILKKFEVRTLKWLFKLVWICKILSNFSLKNMRNLSISRSESLKLGKKWSGYWTISVINVLGRKNAYSIFYQKTESQYALNTSVYNLYKLYIIGRPLPTFTYNIVF